MSNRSPATLDVEAAQYHLSLIDPTGKLPLAGAVKEMKNERWIQPPPMPAAKLLAELSQYDVSTHSLFICDAPREPGAKSRSAVNSHRARIIWADVDHDKADRIFPRALFAKGGPLHTCTTITESGRDNNKHVRALLSRPVSDNALRMLNFALMVVTGGDCKWPGNSLLRVMGSFNPKPEAMRPVRVVQRGTEAIEPKKLLRVLLDECAKDDDLKHITKKYLEWATQEKASGRTLEDVEADIPSLLARVRDPLASVIRRNAMPNGNPADLSRLFFGFLHDLYKGSDLDEDEAYTLMQSYDPFMARMGRRADKEVSKAWYIGDTTPERKEARDNYIMGRTPKSKAQPAPETDDIKTEHWSNAEDESNDEEVTEQDDFWSDLDNAKLLYLRHKNAYCYNSNSKTLYRWDGMTFTRDNADRALLFHTEAVLESYPEPDDPKAYGALFSQRTINAAIGLFQRRIAEPGNTFDRHPHLLNIGPMTYNCTTGKKLKSDPKYRLTKSLGVIYDESATCPRFEKFLAEILPNEAERKFVLRTFAQALNGKSNEKIIPGFVGPKDTGKTVLLEVMIALFGQYAAPIADEVMFKTNGSKHESGLHQLKGARMGYYVEPPVGAKFNDGLMKRLSGGDHISSRAMFGSPESWDSQVTMFLACNSLPKAPDDGALRDRFRFVEFNQIFANDRQDKQLKSKLLEELPGILNLLLEDYQDYRREGLIVPASVKAFNKQLTDAQNPVQEFLLEMLQDEKIALGDADSHEERVTLNGLHEAYETWHKRYNGPRGLIKKIPFGKRMRQLGYESKKSNNQQYWAGLHTPVADLT